MLMAVNMACLFFRKIHRNPTFSDFETVVHVASHNIIKRKIIMMVNLSHR